MTATRLKERIGKAVFAAAAVICVIAVVAIFAFLIYKSIPAFGKLGVFRFMFGDNWSPDRLDTYDSPLSGTYGILTMIAGTLTATVGALLVGGVLGYFTAIFLAFYCPPAPRRVLSAVINLLAGIPSVVYGFFGIVFLLPLLARIAPNNGYVKTMLGHIRYLPEFNMGVGSMTSFAQRAAINTIVQGGSADIIKKAMIDVFSAFRNTPVQMTMQVHDELIFEVPQEGLTETAARIKGLMQNAVKLRVPLLAAAKAGKNWYELEKLPL